MRVPKNDSLINRTLFNNDPTQSSISKKQTDLNQKEQLETEKEGYNKQFINSQGREDLARPQETGFTQINSLRTFFYLKELLADWLTEFSVRPTQINIIVSVTLYLIALSSTIQRRDGDRWLKSLLNAKLPGYSTLYQDTSWETFRSSTSKRLIDFQSHISHDNKHLLDNQSPYLFSSFQQKKTENLKTHTLKRNNRNSSNSPVDKGLENINRKHFQFVNSPLGRGNAIGFEKRQFVDLYKDKALIYLRSPWEKGIRKDFVGFFAKRQSGINKGIPQNLTFGLPKGTHEGEEAFDTNHIVLPWYRIDAYNRPNRIVFATPKQKESKITVLSTPGATEGEFTPSIQTKTPQKDLKESVVQHNKQNCNTFNLSKTQNLRDRRERSLLGLREKQKHSKSKLGSTTGYSTPSQLSSHFIRDKVLGLEYLFSFQTSKGRVYAQNDSIPFKLESAYSLRDHSSSSPKVSSTEETGQTVSILEAALLNLTKNKLKEQNNDLFIKNQQVFFGKNFYFFQKRLRELFYWYGLLPPSNVMELVDKKLSQSQVDKQTFQNEPNSEIKVENFEENASSPSGLPSISPKVMRGTKDKQRIPDRNLDQISEESIQSSRPDSLQGEKQTLKTVNEEEKEKRVANSLKDQGLADIAAVNLLNKNINEDKLSYDRLTTLICKELGILPSDTTSLKSDLKKQANQEMLELFAYTPEQKRLENKKAYSGLAESITEIAETPKSSSANTQSFAGMSRSGEGAFSGQSDTSLNFDGVHNNVNFVDRLANINDLSQPNRFNLDIKQQIEKLIDKSADQSSTLADFDQSTSRKKRMDITGSPDNLSALDVSSLSVTPRVEKLDVDKFSKLTSSGDLELEAEELQETIAQFPFKNWPLHANINSFAQQDGAISNRFEKNDAIFTRFMSGYKFPDCTKQKTSLLFREFVLPHLFISGSVGFSHSYLINQTILRPLYIKLPPVLPFSFFEKLALSLCERSPLSGYVSSRLINFGAVPERESASISSKVLRGTEDKRQMRNKEAVTSFNPNTLNKIPQNSNIKIEYKRISLQELKEIKEAFTKLGRDYQDYLNLPKDSPPAIRISPSLEDDNVIKLEAEHKEKGDEERVTTLERLQKLRQREERFEQGKELRPFAYRNQFAFQPDTQSAPTSQITTLNNNKNVLGKSILPKMNSESSHLVLQDPAFTEEENSWIRFRFGPQNLLSDRKYSFFGRKHMLTKRLVAQEQKEIANQITKNSYHAPSRKFFNEKEHTSSSAFENASARRSAKDLLTEQKESPAFFKSFSGTGKGNSDKRTEHYTDRLLSNRKLQRRARKGLIKLLGSPDLSAHNIQGSLNRTRKANRALRGKPLKSAYSHLRWQKKRFASRMLGTPSKRHFIMPEITSNDWKKMLEWQLKNYFFLEEKRLEPLIKENPEKSFKVKQLHLYLPWVTIRTPSNKPFQWPYTRLDYADCTISNDGDIQRLLKSDIHTAALKSLPFSGQDLKVLASVKRKHKEARMIEDHLLNRLGAKTLYRLPEYKPLYYWDSGKSVSLSVPVSASKAEQNKSAGAKKKGRSVTRVIPDGIRRRTREESYLCEPLTNHSWLLIYRLFLAFAFKNIVKYVYRVSLKGFMVEIANSDFGLTITSPQFREWLQGTQPKSFYTPKKRLRDVAAIEESIPIISEIVWYLRNSGRGKSASRGFLLVGPAGSEKSSVVQAIAGECRVPVVVQSMNALALTDQEPYERLQHVFALARQKAPCVLFLDDLDIIGQSRANVIKNDIGAGDSLFSLDTYTAEGKLRFANLSNSLHTQLLPTSGNRDRHLSWQFNPLAANPAYQPNMESGIEQKITAQGQKGRALSTLQQNQDSQTRRLNLLLCLLTEMDGIAPLNGVVILATSERPALLDPALLRAGRFERKIHISLPTKERRIQLFKTGTQKIGRMQSIPWDYLGMRTKDMSAANIASAINHSAIRAILDNTVHTVESLEHGLNCVSGLPNRNLSVPVFQGNDPFHYSRLAFYQAGKAVVHNLLLDHPQLGFCTLNDAVRNQMGTGYITRENTQVLVSDQVPFKTASPLLRPEFNWVTEGGPSASDSATPIGSSNLDSALNLAPDDQSKKQGDKRVSIRKKGLFSNALSKEIKRRERSIRSQFNKSFSSPKVMWDIQAHKKGTPVSARTRIQFETRLVGLYAGKAAELLYLSSNVVSHRADKVAVKTSLAVSVKSLTDTKNFIKVQPDLVYGHLKSSKTSGWLWQSNLGFSELLTASSLIHLMIDRWYLYSQKLFTYKVNKLLPSLNHEQMRDESFVPLAKRLSQELESNSIKPNFWGLTSYTNQAAAYGQKDSTNEFSLNKQIYQERGRTNWWQAKICQALEMGERPYGKWYRIYLPKIEEREQNKEWVPPDTIFHQSLTLSNLAKNRFKESPAQERIDAVSPSRKSGLKRYPLSVRESTELKDALTPDLLAERAKVKKASRTRPGLPIRRNKRSETRFVSADSPLQKGRFTQQTSEKSPSMTDENAWKANLTKVSSSNSVRSLRLVRLNLNKQSSPRQSVPSLKTLNDFYLFERDSAHQKAVMSCFYRSFNLLNENRELLDYFADHLIRFKILRSHEISKICSLFYPPSK